MTMINDESIQMISEQFISSFFLLSLHLLLVQSFDSASTCSPKKLILLSNCTLQLPSSSFSAENRTLSITVPNTLENEKNFIQLIRRRTSSIPIIRFNLTLIQCSNQRHWNWNSVEASSTLRGEFIRTTLIEPNQMYLSLGVTYLRNLSSIDCTKKIVYRTSTDEIFRLDLKSESTLNDSCSEENPCSPTDIYQCDRESQRCICRPPFESYFSTDQPGICLQAVQRIDQCQFDHQRCLPWCNPNNSLSQCLCPAKISSKKLRSDNRVYCESRRNGMCHSLLQCPADDRCIDGLCQNVHHRWNMREYLSWNLLFISIVIASSILAVIILLLSISLCLLRRRHRGKEPNHSSFKSVYKNNDDEPITHHSPTEAATARTTSDYDNILYGIFRQNLHLSRTEEKKNDDRSSHPPFDPSTTYNPKVVYLGGEQQLTAIYA